MCVCTHHKISVGINSKQINIADVTSFSRVNDSNKEI